MAGKGSEVGRSFEELKEIMDRVSCKEKLGVCFDTCHVWDGGYDIVNHLDEVLSEFDRLIGLDKLCAVHLNDSMMTVMQARLPWCVSGRNNKLKNSGRKA